MRCRIGVLAAWLSVGVWTPPLPAEVREAAGERPRGERSAFTPPSARSAQPQGTWRGAWRRARAQHLARSEQWLRLLHYRRDLFGTLASDVDGRGFFLDEDGATDPAAELAATLRAFFEPVPSSESERSAADAHVLCRFPARFAFLREHLPELEALTQPTCPAFAQYYWQLDPESVAVVYASNSLQDPASAFGHTFLWIRSRNSRHEAFGGYGVEFTALKDTNNPLLYAFKGVAGLFEGRFLTVPFEQKRQEYGARDARDLWVYELALTESERRLLVFHLWELSNTHIQYRYISENCSYHLLTALEGAVERLELRSHLKPAVLPPDTVKSLFENPGLVRDVSYIPSDVRARRQQRQREHAEATPPPWSEAPHRGHGVMRASLGSGVSTQSGGAYYTAGYRVAIHDLADPAFGYPELLQVQFLDTHLRYDWARRLLTVERITFAEVMDLHPIDEFEQRASFRLRAYGQRLRDRGCSEHDCFAHGLNGALGVAFADASRHLAFFALASADLLFAPDFDLADLPVRVGIGPYLGVRWNAGRRFVALLQANGSYLPAQTPRTTYDVRGSLRWTVGHDVAMGVEAALQPESFEAQLASHFYF